VNRQDFSVFYPVYTRWMDNDVYGHVNNVTYYSYFDSTINRYLIERGGLDIHSAKIVGYVVSSSCQFRRPVAYPDSISVGLRVSKLGNSSVTYELGIFRESEEEAAAHGQVVHVFVDRDQNCSVTMPAQIRHCLNEILAAQVSAEEI
jgi:acyl-CoA thioester hydrolase